MDQTDEGAEAGARMRRVGSVLESFFGHVHRSSGGPIDASARVAALRDAGRPALVRFCRSGVLREGQNGEGPALLSGRLPEQTPAFQIPQDDQGASRGAQAEVSMASSVVFRGQIGVVHPGDAVHDPGRGLGVQSLAVALLADRQRVET